MPIERFWLLEKNVSRIQAADNLERLHIGAAAQSKDGYEETHARLTGQIGVIASEQPKLDRVGLGRLKEVQQGPMK